MPVNFFISQKIYIDKRYAKFKLTQDSKSNECGVVLSIDLYKEDAVKFHKPILSILAGGRN